MYVMYLLSYNFVEHRREAVKVGKIRNKRKYPFRTPNFLRISGLKIESFHFHDERKLFFFIHYLFYFVVSPIE